LTQLVAIRVTEGAGGIQVVDVIEATVDFPGFDALIPLLLVNGINQGLMTLLELLPSLFIHLGARGGHIEIHLHLLEQFQAALRFGGFCRRRIIGRGAETGRAGRGLRVCLP